MRLLFVVIVVISMSLVIAVLVTGLTIVLGKEISLPASGQCMTNSEIIKAAEKCERLGLNTKFDMGIDRPVKAWCGSK